MADKTANLSQIRNFFGMSATEMRTEWAALSDTDKEEIKILVGEQV